MAVIKEIPILPNVSSLTIGRKPDNDIVIDNPAVSGHHARFFKIGSSYFIEDLNSTNGTFIKGKKILKAEIHNGDEIHIAKHSLVFICEEEKPVARPVEVPTPLPAEEKPEVYKPVASEKIAYIRIVDGIVDKEQIELVAPVIYIGTEQTAGIRVKPSGGLFGSFSGMAALISKRQNSFILKAMEKGYPKVNGQNIDDQIELKDGDIIEVGKTKMVFSLKQRG